MNKIKFRAWNNYHDEMVYWDELLNEPYGKTEDFTDGVLEHMQYTGLEDKNGVEICEGDIVKVEGHPFDSNGNFNGNYRVVWNQESLTYLAGNLLLFRLKPYMTVIGNVYQNSELLGVSRK